MHNNKLFQGSLFAEDFLSSSITQSKEWETLNERDVERCMEELQALFEQFPITKTPNERQTEVDLIWPILKVLGWTASLEEQNLSSHGRKDVPDGLLFANEDLKVHANSFAEEWQRYQFGSTIVEAKRWNRPLDRRSERLDEEATPSTQMLRYLRRVDDVTEGKLRWGILTNGTKWRLYYQGARSVSEQFFEVDLATLLALQQDQKDLSPHENERQHYLKIFFLIFGPQAFLPRAADPSRTFHHYAIEEGQFYEQRVSNTLSEVVFDKVFPRLASAIAEAVPTASLTEVREATLVFLYRLLFILYAEDRDLLPIRDNRYDDYAFREKVRQDVRRRKNRKDTFLEKWTRYWSFTDDLCRAIDQGDAGLGLPPYNGGLFDRKRTRLLESLRLGDQVMAEVVDALSFEETPQGRHYINYRDLGVQQLGSIYERLLEYVLVREGGELKVRPNIYARKGSGSYYTPDDLVVLIIKETLDPLLSAHMDAFTTQSKALENTLTKDHLPTTYEPLEQEDPAEKMLELKVCDPAMGSGHFLVNLVDYLTDRVIAAMAEAEAVCKGYISPLNDRIDNIRKTILDNAETRGWTIDREQLDDRHIIRRMVLKRCVYGVDKNPMAVELAKVALWLHTFTVGAPLSFLDHHLRCGDSLFGSWVASGSDKAEAQGGALFLREPLTRALESVSAMQLIESLTDAEIAEANLSAENFAKVEEMTTPLNTFLSLLHAFDWLNIQDREDKEAFQFYLKGTFGDPVDIAQKKCKVRKRKVRKHNVSQENQYASRFVVLLEKARKIVAEEGFLNWQVSFPGVWSDWECKKLRGGFDAVIGNPPWNRIKMQQIEWFALHRRDIAMIQRAVDRRRMIAALGKSGDPLSHDFNKDSERAVAAIRMARTGGDYPLLSGGDVNIYSLFVERAMTLIKPTGLIGLLTPSGIASDKTAVQFFKEVVTEGRLKALYDFENRRTRYNDRPFFPDVDDRFKFCILVASGSRLRESAQCAFFLQDVSELDDPERRFSMKAKDFKRFNPNTVTAPIFRSCRDLNLTTTIYDLLPVLANRSTWREVKTWPVKHTTMFHMTNDSALFRTRKELKEQEGAWPIGRNRYDSAVGEWLPLYEGKMVQAFDHRAASIVINPKNQHRPAQPLPTSSEQHRDPNWLPNPQFWVLKNETTFPKSQYLLTFKNVTAPTNMRTMIAAFIPNAGVSYSLPIVYTPAENGDPSIDIVPLLANFNAIPFDYVARQKIQSTSLSWYMLEQLPVVPPEEYDSTFFGSRSARGIIRELVLELTYSSHDMAPFARDMGYVDDLGTVKPPFLWDERRRLVLRAKLDAVFFLLYGITKSEDVSYIYSTFPIIERQEYQIYGDYRSRELCLAWMNALAAGNPDTNIDI